MIPLLQLADLPDLITSTRTYGSRGQTATNVIDMTLAVILSQPCPI